MRYTSVLAERATWRQLIIMIKNIKIETYIGAREIINYYRKRDRLDIFYKLLCAVNLSAATLNFSAAIAAMPGHTDALFQRDKSQYLSSP